MIRRRAIADLPAVVRDEVLRIMDDELQMAAVTRDVGHMTHAAGVDPGVLAASAADLFAKLADHWIKIVEDLHEAAPQKWIELAAWHIATANLAAGLAQSCGGEKPVRYGELPFPTIHRRKT